MMHKHNSIIVDLDGTLSDSSHRVRYLEQKPKDWDSFYIQMSFDHVNHWCLDLIKRYAHDHQVLFVTGRPAKYEKETRNWLNQNLYFPYQLYMRETEDKRPDYEVKHEIYKIFIEPKFRVVLALDDRQQVVNMWRSLGILTLQCAAGNF